MRIESWPYAPPSSVYLTHTHNRRQSVNSDCDRGHAGGARECHHGCRRCEGGAYDAGAGGFCADGRHRSSWQRGSRDLILHRHRISHQPAASLRIVPVLHDDFVSPLFLAVIEATEEAILNSLFMSGTTTGKAGKKVEGLPVATVMAILDAHKRIIR